MEHHINRRFLGIKADPNFLGVPPLSDEIALEKGVEYTYEVFLYGFLILVPLYELKKEHDEKL